MTGWILLVLLSMHFRGDVIHLSAVSVLVLNGDDSMSMSSGSCINSNVSDDAEYADRVINASHGIWITDKRRKK